MPQETNLNVSPYFDDFNEDKNFKRVLFKPGSPVQARELTQLQTILQNQIEKFGQHFFKEGSIVIPGQLSYDAQYEAIELQNTFLGVPVSEYLDQLVGKVIKGETSGVEAKVVNYILSTRSDRGTNTLYIKYTKAGNDFTTNTFNDGENLIASTDIEYGLSSRVIANNPFATTIALNAASTGSAASVAEGVYFIRGYFVKVTTQTVIIDQYDNSPTARVGLYLDENVVTAFDDATLFDNAAGFSNFAAPGADRFQLKPTLISKDIDDLNDANFIELLRVRNGNREKFVKKTEYNIIADELARRTYDESGNYYVTPFGVQVRESLNNREGNNGVYFDTQKTSKGNDPSSDLMIYQVGPGKAYVRGYEIENPGNDFLDVEKPRTTKTLKKQAIAFDRCSKIKLNRVFGAASVGLGNNTVIELRDQRCAASQTSGAGNQIGVARVYDFKLEAAAYSNDASVYECFLWDIQTFTTLVVNSSLTAIDGSIIEGARSGARGYLKTAASGATLSLTSVSGEFVIDEPIKVNGVEDGKTITSITEFSIDDVKSIFKDYGGGREFAADTVLSRLGNPAPAGTEYTIATNGVVRVGGSRFRSGIKIGDIVKYQKSNESDPTYNRVSAINSAGTEITIDALSADVAGVCQKERPSGSAIVTSDFKIARAHLIDARNSSLLSDLPATFISNVDLGDSEVQIRKEYSVNVSSSRATVTITDTDLFFETFDEERYNLTFANGAVQALTEENIQFNATRKTATLVGLNQASSSGSIFLTTLKRTTPKAQTKSLTRCKTITINKSKLSGSGTANNTKNDGLTTSAVYGTRVQDNEICLNVPDGVRVHAVFESSTKGNPVLPRVVLVNRSSNLNNTIQGEIMLGTVSGAAARVVASTAKRVDVVYINDLEFEEEERVIFKSSGISGDVSRVDEGDKEVSSDFRFDTGQRAEYYDYARIIRKQNTPDPSKRITIVFDHYILDGDAGDFATVNSYSADNFENDLPTFRGTDVSDYIDARPRVKEISTSSASPFDYDSRDFSVSGVAPSVLVGDETVTLTYSHYLSRVDKIYLSKDGFFELKQGSPAPQGDVVPPEDPAGSFCVATIFCAPYVRRIRGFTNVIVAKHKRYTMSDIARLESRVKNVEFYTQLSLLETDTATLTITDAKSGLDRFKSGFFVDNFKSHSAHAVGHPNFSTSIDKAKGELRPTHYTHGLDLLLGSEQVIGIGTTADPNADLSEVADLQSNDLKRSGDIVTLNFDEVEFISQRFATRTENVNPFAAVVWVGGVELNPNSDVWINEKRLDANVVDVEGDYAKTLHNLQIDPNTGLSPIDWNSWEEVWSSTDVSVKKTGSKQSGFQNTRVERWSDGGDDYTRTHQLNTTTDYFEESTTVDRGMSRSGIQFEVVEKIDSQSLGDKLVSQETIPYMRSRNIEFVATRVQPGTRFYTFFDGQDVDKFMTPKLLEVEMESGVFQVGETVVGTKGDPLHTGSGPRITFRTAQPDHKFGSYNDPRIVYDVNPYSDTIGIGSNYSATSTILNIDTKSLQEKVLGKFHGYVSKGMDLVGNTSGAIAKIVDVRLVSDEKGALLGSFFIPDPTFTSAPEFRTGKKTFRMSSSKTDSRAPLDRASAAQANFRAEGTLNTIQEDIMNIRNAEIQQNSVSDSKIVSKTTTKTFQTQSFEERHSTQVQYSDPLAESFEVTDINGVFINSCDIWFQTKDTKIPVTCQIRTMASGLPTTKILAFAECTLDPNQVEVSKFGTKKTTFTFPSPVYLEGGGEEYAIVLISQSNDYNVFICRMGDEDLEDRNLEESERRIVSQQPYLGSLFKSQNGSTWDPSQFEDLKFTLNKCKFVAGPGALKLYNPELGEGEMENPILRPNPFTLKSNHVKIELQGNSSTATSNWPIGSRLTQTSNTNTEGFVAAHLGSLNTASYQTGTGIGLTPAGSNLTYTGIGLTSITGDGDGAVASIAINSGTVNSISVTSAGSGYKVGDVLGASFGETGRNVRFSVTAVSGTNSVILDKVQGEFNTSGTLQSIAANGTKTSLNNGKPDAVTTLTPDKSGLYVHVKHRNHGMHASNNRVIISDAVGVTTTTRLSEKYEHNASNFISVDDASVFTSFENIAVSAANTGYVKIGNEIIGYKGTNTGTTPNRLTGISRGVDNTNAETHKAKKRVRKYEAAGVSLRRINTTHQFSTVDNTLQPTLDGYHIKIDVTGTGNGTIRDGSNSFAKLKIAEDEVTGGKVVRATQNIQFEAVTPLIEFMTPVDTSLNTRVRTVSGTSVGGAEASFQDQGFESIGLGGATYFDTPRIISSKINEQNNLTSLPGSKSFTTELILSSKDTNVSPVIDLDRLSIITTTNRLDKVTTDYKTDSRVNSLFDDPNGAVYITKRVNLENPATSLQVRFAAYMHVSNDIRVLYRLIRQDSPVSESPFQLFPGYRNLRDTTGDGFGDELINYRDSDGTPDRRVPASRHDDEMRDHQYTANDLVEFHGFQIKVIMTGTNQAKVPRIRDFRAIGLA